MRLREEFGVFRRLAESVEERLIRIDHGVQRIMAKLEDFNQAFTAYTDGVKAKIDALNQHVSSLETAAANADNPDLDAAIARVRQATDDLNTHADTAPTPPTGGSSEAAAGAGAGQQAGAAGQQQPGTAAPQADQGTGQDRVADTAGNRA